MENYLATTLNEGVESNPGPGSEVSLSRALNIRGCCIVFYLILIIFDFRNAYVNVSLDSNMSVSRELEMSTNKLSITIQIGDSRASVTF